MKSRGLITANDQKLKHDCEYQLADLQVECFNKDRTIQELEKHMEDMKEKVQKLELQLDELHKKQTEVEEQHRKEIEIMAKLQQQVPFLLSKSANVPGTRRDLSIEAESGEKK